MIYIINIKLNSTSENPNIRPVVLSMNLPKLDKLKSRDENERTSTHFRSSERTCRTHLLARAGQPAAGCGCICPGGAGRPAPGQLGRAPRNGGLVGLVGHRCGGHRAAAWHHACG